MGSLQLTAGRKHRFTSCSAHSVFVLDYTSTEGSVVFYSCDPGLVPEGRMRAVCTENGWSPKPADLNCFSSILDNSIHYMQSYLCCVYL